ncbi:hypothetical protein EJ08DRAFT_702529 [Tothia fuscella]|uniref:Uncharacterized protein n=1 Tax=Tothia fuscella TaxID=1048955 RepID=A0A9P4TT29_9PEZI|nr:hypothetical protein EJ08DRAFT_702529 [Tothia fuscella]
MASEEKANDTSIEIDCFSAAEKAKPVLSTPHKFSAVQITEPEGDHIMELSPHSTEDLLLNGTTANQDIAISALTDCSSSRPRHSSVLLSSFATRSMGWYLPIPVEASQSIVLTSTSIRSPHKNCPNTMTLHAGRTIIATSSLVNIPSYSP